ncbi:type II toxin-antitoxin system RelE/ParE family toxin [Levilactobacillus wangkuiensis]|uniref:type II toxin-antitoxin system RelE/ParE family toxin n=1 Tax=Levilactobacillus wangkuiensis TaxID=2799566 RepID=UPI001942D1D8|nr:plasmid maintenance system killer protein [Levilactobacillus wangkuiensis]
MEINYESQKIEKTFSTQVRLVRKFGLKIATGIQRRVEELTVADTLDEISHFPPSRLHLLTGNLRGYFAVSVTENVRLIFEGMNDFQEVTTNKEQITQVIIMKVSDYHDK